jgi:AraC-like DNA-binding protein
MPEFVVSAPLPPSILADQIGVLLALIANELSGATSHPAPVARSLRDRIHDCIVQRCPEIYLVAADVAASLNISLRTLHRALAACGETFGGKLLEARLELAVRMLESPLMDRLTTAEIARRAGFADASHFARMIRKRTGQTPVQLRRRRET